MLADVQQSDSCCLTSFSRLGRQGPGTLLQILAGAMRIHHRTAMTVVGTNRLLCQASLHECGLKSFKEDK